MFPVGDEARAKILVARMERRTCGDEGQELLYPELDTHHAVVNRIKAAQGGGETLAQADEPTAA